MSSAQRVGILIAGLQIQIEVVSEFWLVGGELQDAITVALQVLQRIEIVLKEKVPAGLIATVAFAAVEQVLQCAADVADVTVNVVKGTRLPALHFTAIA